MDTDVPRRRARRRTLIGLAAVAMALASAAPAAADETIVSDGPLTEITTSSQLNCDVRHTGDDAPQFYAGTACGTFVTVDGELFGPQDVPAGSNANPRTAYTPVSQSPVTGAGTSADPFRVTTVVALGETGVQATQTDTYVAGEETYQTAVSLANPAGGAARSGRVYRAGDCFLQDDDTGYGLVGPQEGAIACSTSPEGGERLIQWLPITPGSSFYEGSFGGVWLRIGQQGAFPSSCDCETDLDNGAGLSWDYALGAGQTRTFAHATNFSPTGKQPLTTEKVATSPTATVGSGDAYTITVTNPNEETTSASLVDVLPPGFRYVAGSATGATATVTQSGDVQTVTFSPVPVPGGGTAQVGFQVTVGYDTGTFTNAVTGSAGSGYSLVGTGETAPVTVTRPASLAYGSGTSGIGTRFGFYVTGGPPFSGRATFEENVNRRIVRREGAITCFRRVGTSAVFGIYDTASTPAVYREFYVEDNAGTGRPDRIGGVDKRRTTAPKATCRAKLPTSTPGVGIAGGDIVVGASLSD